MADGRRVVYMDLYPVFLRDGILGAEYGGDGLHLNAAGCLP